MATAQWSVYRVHLHDQAPAIGAGTRLVSVRIGHKWVRLRDPWTGRKRARLARSEWDKMEAAPTELTEAKCRAIRRRALGCVTWRRALGR